VEKLKGSKTNNTRSTATYTWTRKAKKLGTGNSFRGILVHQKTQVTRLVALPSSSSALPPSLLRASSFDSLSHCFKKPNTL
jgi:hypothetical protein